MMLLILEGLDGAGKTTLATELTMWLRRQRQVNVTAAADPGTTEVGEWLRTGLFAPELKMTGLTRVLLHLAARQELNDQVVGPALLSGDTVVLDRHYPSTIAYNWAGSGLGLEQLQQLNMMVNRMIFAGQPQVVVLYLRLSVDAALGRIAARHGAKVAYEAGSMLNNAYIGYELQLQQDKLATWITLDATLSERQVLDQAKQTYDGLSGYSSGRRSVRLFR